MALWALLTHAGETRFSTFALGNLGKLGHFVNFMGLMLTLTLEIVSTIPGPWRPCKGSSFDSLALTDFSKILGGQKFRKFKLLVFLYFSSDLSEI